MVAVGLAVGLSSYPVADLDATNQLVRLIGVAGVVLMVAAMVIRMPKTPPSRKNHQARSVR